jgi:hypothetical protein
MPANQDLTFEEFRQAVGSYGEQKIRAALVALNLTPYTKVGDMRRTYYNSDWIVQVRNFLEGRR